MTKPQIGAIIEIPTRKGLAYAQYTHQHDQFGGLLRIFDEILQTRPTEFSTLIKGLVRFSTFFPLRAAVRRGIFKVVAHADVAPHNRSFPLFRAGNADPRTKRVAVWWLWDGEKAWRVGELTSEQRSLPIKSVWNDTMLVKRIEEGWTPEQDSR